MVVIDGPFIQPPAQSSLWVQLQLQQRLPGSEIKEPWEISENMEKTSASATYNDLVNTLNERLAEQKHRHLWLFLYSSRHAHLQLHQPHRPEDIDLHERNQLIDDTVCLLENFAPQEFMLGSSSQDRLTAAFNKFCFGIIYAIHRRHCSDGFIDVRFEETLTKYDAFIDSLTPREIVVASKLHNLSYKYGFLITELWLPLIRSTELMDIFTTQYPKIRDSFSIPSFVFTKKGNHPKGIQISTKKYPAKIYDTWDLLLFIKENDNLSKIKSKVHISWNIEGQQIVGDYYDHEIALYVDRNECTVSHVVSTLRLQIDHLNDYINGFITVPTPEEPANLERSTAIAQKEMRNKLSTTIDRIRLSEGMISKRWSIDKSNIRRSVGLYLWDKINAVKTPRGSRKYLITELINELKSKTPEVLDLYLGKFNKYDPPKNIVKFGDLAKPLETVIREMEADYDLTAYCIKNFEYLTPHDVKSGGKKNRT